MVSWVRELVEVEALHVAAKEPWDVEEGERKRGCGDRAWRRRSHLGSLQDFDCVVIRRRSHHACMHVLNSIQVIESTVRGLMIFLFFYGFIVIVALIFELLIFFFKKKKKRTW